MEIVIFFAILAILFAFLFAFLFAEDGLDLASVISFVIAIILSIWLTMATVQENRYDIIGSTEIVTIESGGYVKNGFIREDGKVIILDDVYTNPEDYEVEILDRQNWYLGIRFSDKMSHRVVKKEKSE